MPEEILTCFFNSISYIGIPLVLESALLSMSGFDEKTISRQLRNDMAILSFMTLANQEADSAIYAIVNNKEIFDLEAQSGIALDHICDAVFSVPAAYILPRLTDVFHIGHEKIGPLTDRLKEYVIPVAEKTYQYCREKLSCFLEDLKDIPVRYRSLIRCEVPLAFLGLAAFSAAGLIYPEMDGLQLSHTSISNHVLAAGIAMAARYAYGILRSEDISDNLRRSVVFTLKTIFIAEWYDIHTSLFYDTITPKLMIDSCKDLAVGVLGIAGAGIYIQTFNRK